jgi:transposase
MGTLLTSDQREILYEAHHSSRMRKSADRIKAILLLDEGFSYQQVAKILLLDEMTIRRYKKEYQKEGVDGLLENRYQGSNGNLTTQQEEALREYLKEHIYQTVKSIVAYVSDTYGKDYSVEGMTHVLHRLHFSYKKTKVIPGKYNAEKQGQFKEGYEELKKNKNPEDRIYFVDACHPHHNNRPFYGWIYKGEEKSIKTNSGRERLNLNGALSLENMDITVLSEETINQHAMMRLCLTIEEKQPNGEIHFILDNASYNHGYELQLFLEDHPRIHIHYLPAYSPNLNIIERLWRFFHEKLQNNYFEKFPEFEQAVLTFFNNINQYNDELKTLLTDSFQSLPT